MQAAATLKGKERNVRSEALVVVMHAIIPIKRKLVGEPNAPADASPAPVVYVAPFDCWTIGQFVPSSLAEIYTLIDGLVVDGVPLAIVQVTETNESILFCVDVSLTTTADSLVEPEARDAKEQAICVDARYASKLLAT